MAMDEVTIDHKLKIRKYTSAELKERYEETANDMSFMRADQVSRNPFIIELIYEVPKQEPNISVSLEQIFQDILTTLRLLKSGSVGSGLFYTKSITWNPTIGGRIGGDPGRIMYGAPYELRNEEIPRLLKLYNQILQNPIDDNHPLALAIRRFNYAYERKRAEDKLIDLMIAFEALLLPENDELKLRLSLRVANLLRDIAERSQVFNEIRQAYRLRSDIVHGHKKIDSKEIIQYANIMEERLRQSIICIHKSINLGKKSQNIIKELDNPSSLFS